MQTSAVAPPWSASARFDARSRLAAVVLAVALVAGLGCRTRWSADGKPTMYAALQGEAHVVAEYAVDASRAKKLFDR